ncbi:MAG: sigma-70 family RNA polymerase sigma factor [Bacilli bacterium]|jgi:RNA polymerase sigma-70 factor (ECF subfamily)|nr:sigma-70 family RNA polymerase sigma factor [Bacilli bacterium]
MLVSKKTAQLFISGDEKAIQEVYLSYRKLLFFILGSILGSKDEAEDLFQETFYQVLKNKDKIADPQGLHYYLLQTARNLALNYVKKRERTVYFEDMFSYESQDKKENAFLQDLLPYLTDQEAFIVTSRLVYGFTLKEISQFISLPLSSTEAIYKKALKKIKSKYLKGE